MKKVREDLNNLYNTLNTLRTELSQVRERFRLHVSEAKRLSAELRKVSSIATRESIDSIKEEIERLEWILITTPNLDLEEEKKIVEKISQLEKKLKEISTYQRTSFDLHVKYEELSNEIDKLKNELKEKTNSINLVKEKIAQLKEARDKLKKDVENVVNSIKELKKRRDELKNSLKEVITAISTKSKEYKEVLKELNKIKEEREKAGSKAYISRRREEIKGKLERGERVTLYDLYLLYSEEGKP